MADRGRRRPETIASQIGQLAAGAKILAIPILMRDGKLDPEEEELLEVLDTTYQMSERQDAAIKQSSRLLQYGTGLDEEGQALYGTYVKERKKPHRGANL